MPALRLKMAGFLDSQFEVETLEYIDIKPKACIPSESPTGIHRPEKTGSHEKELESRRRTSVFRFSDSLGSDPLIEMLSLPHFQPQCPKHWSAEDWNNRTVIGTSRCHVYYSGTKPYKCFVLQLSERLDSTGKQCYVNILNVIPDVSDSLSYLKKILKEYGELVHSTLGVDLRRHKDAV